MATTSSSLIEEVATSLVREYLNRKGLKITLSSLDNELPRTEKSISNRSALAKELGIIDLLKVNKSSSSPYKAMLEVLVHHFMTTPSHQHSSLTTPPHQRSPTGIPRRIPDLKSSPKEIETPPTSPNVVTDSKPITSLTSRRGHQYCINPTSEPLTTPTKSTNIRSRGVATSAVTKHKQSSSTKSKLELMTSPLSMDMTPSKPQDHMMMTSDHVTPPITSTEPKYRTTTESMQTNIDVLCEDLECQQLDDVVHPQQSHENKVTHSFPCGQPIKMSVAQALREVVFGSATVQSFNEEWRMQGFTFSDCPQLQYGLIQLKGGPCGVLACVQAYILKYLLFSNPYKSLTEIPQPTLKEKQQALISAFCEILWKASDNNHAILTLKSCKRYSASPIKTRYYWPDQITEMLVTYEFTDYNLLKSFLQTHIGEFTFVNKTSCGCILLLYSVILSRGIQRLQSDFDDPNNYLIGVHGYCTQELINLLLTGKGTSNTFDGNLFIDSDYQQLGHKLRGLDHQSDIGYLTLFEHYGTCQVGHYYKSPQYPIFVICSESHFTVLFGLSMKILEEDNKFISSKFDLHYYDGLGQFTEPVILSVDISTTTITSSTVTSSDSSLIPPLDLCIRTKWRPASIKWNCEPLL